MCDKSSNQEPPFEPLPCKKEGNKEMFSLTTHLTHFIYGNMKGKGMFYLTTHSTYFNYGSMKGRGMFYLTTHSTHLYDTVI